MTKGALIAISGVDGSGKTTQTKLLTEHAKTNGYRAVRISFPRYDTPTGKVIRAYLDGNFGSLKEINPKSSAMWYAADRYAAKSEIENILNSGTNIILDRYVADNLAHQGCKLEGKERIDLVNWIQELEYSFLRITPPDLSICLHLPVHISMDAIIARDQGRDLHERDIFYLSKVEKTFLMLPDFESHFEIFECSNSREERLSKEEVMHQLWKKIKTVLVR